MQWLGTLVTGLAMLVVTILLLTKTVGEQDVLFGVMIGVNMILGGISTLWLRWSARRSTTVPQQPPSHAEGGKKSAFDPL